MTQDYAVKITVRNARILSRMRECNVTSAKQLADMAGVSYVSVVEIIAMKRPAYSERRDDYTDTAHRIAAVLRCDPDDLFTDAQRTMRLEKNSMETFVDEPTMAMLASSSAERQVWQRRELEHLMSTLGDREKRIVTARLEERTYEDIGQEEGVHRNRVHQIERRAIRKMKGAAFRNERNFRLNGVSPYADRK
jgi:RNA polymerase sigma factor (sigma-70 family)